MSYPIGFGCPRPCDVRPCGYTYADPYDSQCCYRPGPQGTLIAPVAAGSAQVVASGLTAIPATATTLPVAGSAAILAGFAPEVQNGVTVSSAAPGTTGAGLATVNSDGGYGLSATVAFEDTGVAAAAGDYREVAIYRYAAGVTQLLGAKTSYPVDGTTTYVNVSTDAYLRGGDRVFVALRQVNAAAADVAVVPAGSRFTVVRETETRRYY